MSREPRPRGVTARDIADASGVSVATVSYVLSGREGVRISEQTRQRVLDTARRIGYRRNSLAAALRKGRMHTVGIVCSSFTRNTPAASRYAYVKDLMLALTFAAARDGLTAVLFIDKPVDQLKPEEIADRRVDGAILFNMYGQGEWVQAVGATGLPCVEIGSGYGPYQVHADNEGGAHAAVEHLVGLGHRRIGHWRGPESVPSANQRVQGFRDAVRAAGIPESESPIVSEGREFAEMLRRPDCPTAFFLNNDERAVEALDRMHAAGLQAPRDLSLVGFDNDLRAQTVRPQLTTVQNPLDAMADAAVHLIQAQVAGEEIPAPRVVVPTHLVIRDSTAPPLR